MGPRETQKLFLLVGRGGWRPPCRSEGLLIFFVISVRASVYSLSCTFNSFSRLGASPAHKFSNGMRFERSPGVNPSTSSASVIHIPEDMSYLVDQCIPNALAETSSGPAAFVLSLKNLPGMGPLPDVFYTESKSHSMLDLGSPHVSGPSPHVSGTSPHVSGPSPASLAPSRPCSSSSGSSLTMEIPENMTLLCEESLTDLGAVDGSWC